MALFGRICFPTALRKEIPPFHHYIYKNLADPDIRRAAIAAPRGTAKSTTTSLIYPLWQTAFKRSDEDLFIVIISESQAQSINFLSRIKFHINHSDKFRELKSLVYEYKDSRCKTIHLYELYFNDKCSYHGGEFLVSLCNFEPT